MRFYFAPIWAALLFCFPLVLLGEGLPTVKEIRVEGNQKIENAAIREKILSQVGEPRMPEIIEEDILGIYGLGFFEKIDVYEENVPGGVRLIYVLRERPMISKLEYEGVDELDDDELAEVIQIKKFQVLDYHKLTQSVEALTERYEERGYYLADVQFRLKEIRERNEVEVTFVVEENDKIQVKKINIIGNEVISDDTLKGIMQTKEGGAFSWLTGSGTYREAVFDRDIQAMGYYYGTQGYVRAKIENPQVNVSPDKRWINISFHVTEGEQYSVGDIDFEGELLYSRDELLEDLKLVKGEIFNTDTLRRETLRYTEKYSDLGYAFANVVPQPRIDDERRIVDIMFEVDKGPRVYVGKITILGNTRTKDKVIRRELTIHEGELFNGTRKRQSRENVLRLGFFESVEFNQVSPPDRPQVVDLEIRVAERSTGQLVIGAGYASGDIGFTAQAQLSQNNFLGNGQIASLSAQVLTGKDFYEFNLSFTEPHVGYSDWSLGGDLYNLRRTLFAFSGVPTFEETKFGLKIKAGHPVFEFTNFFLAYKLEHSYVPNTIIDRELIPRDTVNGITSSLTASIVYDKRDDRFDPKNGVFGSLSAEYAGLFGDRNYFKSRATGKFFHPLFWDFIFRLNLTAANISQIGNSPVPINELFIQGGLFSLRGYKHLTIGPKKRLGTQLSQKAAENNLFGKEITIGGHNEVLMNAEIEFPLLKEARIRGVVFFDAGNAFDGFFEGSPKLFANFGWGIRWFTPIGPLRFEFGHPLVEGGSPEFYFTIGPPF